MVERRHVHQESPGKRNVAGDARALLAKRFFRDLDDNFLALLQEIGDQLRAACLGTGMPAVSAVTALGTPATVIASASVAPASAGGMLHARLEIVAYARLPRLLALRLRIFQDSR